MVTVKRARAAAVLGLTLMIVGCGAKSVSQVVADPARYRNGSVTVRGTVDQSASIVGRGAYRISDGGQGLWVVTTSGAPRTGANVEVTGRLQDGYDLGAFAKVLNLPEALRSGLVLIESSHRVR